ncbi:hypothetical protein JHK84_051091 [Glycine max]|nr:hypothetical protein JHK84_051091 [Glycine max]
MNRYTNFATSQHHHLTTVVPLCSNLATERLPLMPPAYFAATISALDASKARLDPIALSSLVSFMAITLPLVPLDGIATPESREDTEILVTVLAREGEGVGVVCKKNDKCKNKIPACCEPLFWAILSLPFKSKIGTQ